MLVVRPMPIFMLRLLIRGKKMFKQNFVWILIGYLLADGQGSATEPDNQGDLAAAEADSTFNGDFLVRTEKNLGILLCTKALNYYKFRSCSRPYLFGKSPIRYRITASKPSPKACASHKRARDSIRNTPNSIAAYASKLGVTGIFDDGGAI